MYRIDSPTFGDTAARNRLLERNASFGASIHAVLVARRAKRNADRFAKVNASTARPKTTGSLASSAR